MLMRKDTSSYLKIELNVSLVPSGSKGAHDPCVVASSRSEPRDRKYNPS